MNDQAAWQKVVRGCVLFLALSMALTAQAAGPPSPPPCSTCVTTTGGLNGNLPLFTGATSIGNSALNQAGNTVFLGTIGGPFNFSVTGQVQSFGVKLLPLSLDPALGANSSVLEMDGTQVDPTTGATQINRFRFQVVPSNLADPANPTPATVNLIYDDGVNPATTAVQLISSGGVDAVGPGGGFFGEDTINTAGYPGAGVIGVGDSDSSAGVEGVVKLAGTFGSTGLLGLSRATSGFTAGVRGDNRSPDGFAGIFDVRNNARDPITGALLPPGNILVGRVGRPNAFVPKFRVDATGAVFADGGVNTTGADFAESLPTAGGPGGYEPGDVLAIDASGNSRLARTGEAYSTRVAGIYSTKPGVLASPHSMNDPAPVSEVPLAVVGIVPCKVTAANGAIKAGDLLVSSDLPGFAMKGTDRARMLGAVVGKALQPLDSGTGMIKVLVTLQ